MVREGDVNRPLSVSETHVSTVFFTGDRAFKLLKPVTTPFLDFGTTERRLAAVDDEIRLNRRLAPDVYLGTADVVEDGVLVDRMIVMRRLATDRRLTNLVGQPGFDDCLRAVVKRVAAFHAEQRPRPGAADIAGRDAVRKNWDDNIGDMSDLVDVVFDRHEFERVALLAHDYLDHTDRLFNHRLQAGFVRDGHGDLTAEDIFCLDDGPRILDCLAFDERLRIADVLNDVAFLAMDLERLAGPAVAAQVWRYYGEYAGEHHPESLAAHYVAYRAHVRAKVAAIRHRQGDQDAAALARDYLRLARQHLERARRRLVLVGGTPGTGKTTLATSLSDTLGWVMLSTDSLRKDLTLRSHTDHEVVDIGEGIYTDDVTERTYHALLGRAEHLLVAGESVILDASFNAEAHRVRARQLAAAQGAELIEIECVLDPERAKARIASRLAGGADASDARPELVDALRGEHEPWPSAQPVSTAGSRDEMLAHALSLVGARPVIEPVDPLDLSPQIVLS